MFDLEFEDFSIVSNHSIQDVKVSQRLRLVSNLVCQTIFSMSTSDNLFYKSKPLKVQISGCNLQRLTWLITSFQF